ncbi:hypothetical protein [Campylobacter cuniculorum]|uniref:hypothetical protein n=1 Tax=Campylobacter cuniculorum TaxID=374106 RepID=UPI0023F10CD4|nr:hypothetical protein [Campylobacter cuniculorum]
MCVLCGELVSNFHWSDVKFKEDNALVIVGSLAKDRMKARLKRVKILNRILEFYGLKIKEWQGSKYVLSNAKGYTIIVNDLGDLWQKAEELYKKPLDALDENLLNFLKSKSCG